MWKLQLFDKNWLNVIFVVEYCSWFFSLSKSKLLVYVAGMAKCYARPVKVFNFFHTRKGLFTHVYKNILGYFVAIFLICKNDGRSQVKKKKKK